MRFLSLTVALLISFLLSFSFLQNVVAQIQSTSDSNIVTMPWSDFQQLWKSGQEEPSQRMRPYAYGKALYEGTTQVNGEDYLLHFKLSFKVETFDEHDHLVPFLAAGLNLEKLIIDGQSATWTLHDGFYQAPIGHAGVHALEAYFTLKIPQEHWPRNLRLPLAPMPQNELQLWVPDQEIEAQLSSGVTVATVAEGTMTKIHAFFPASPVLELKWLKKSEGRQELDLKMDAHVANYISLEEAGAELQSQVDFRILQGQNNVFQVKLPKFLDVLEVTTSDINNGISQWYTEEQGEFKLIHIYSAYQQKEKFSVQLKLEHTTSQSSYPFEVPTIVPQNVDRFDTEVAVGSRNNVEVQELKITDAERLDVRFISESLQAFAKNQALYYYRVLTPQTQLKFQVKSHEQVSLLKTRIDRVEATSVIADSGMVMTKMTFLVKNNQAQFLRFQLPDKAHLLSVFLKGKEVQPSLDQNNQLLLPIVKSVNSSFPVEIAFLAKQSSFFWFGHKLLDLVQSDLPVGELHWQLYVPDNYQTVYFGGNVQMQGYSSLSKLKNLIRHFVYYEGSQAAYAGGDKSYDYNSQGLRKRFKAGKKEMYYGNGVSKSIQKDLASRQIQVDIPVSGRGHPFHAYLLKDKVPHLSFLYINQSLKEVFHLIIQFIVALFAFVILSLIFERVSIPQKLKRRRVYLKALVAFAGFFVLLMVFSLDAFVSIIQGFWLALFAFVLWQNRQRAKNFRQQIQHRYFKYVPEALLILCLPILLITLMTRVSWLIVLTHLSVIVFFCFAFRLLPWMMDRVRSMKNTKAAVTSVLLLLFTTTLVLGFEKNLFAGPEEGDGFISPSAQVKMDWDLIQSLFQKKELLEKEKNRRLDRDYVFGNAEISGKIIEKRAYLKIVVPLKVLAKSYIQVPLFEESVSISEAKLGGQDLLLNFDNSEVYFETRAAQATQQNLELEVMLPLKERGGVWELSLEAEFLKGASLDLATGTQVESSTVFGAVWQDQTGENLKAVLNNDELLKVELATFKREDIDNSHNQGVKKRYANTYTLVSLENNVATFYSSIRYEILNDQVREFSIRLPESVIVHEIIGEDLEDWKKVSTKDGVTAYRARVLYPASQRYDLSVKYEVLLKKEQKQFTLPNLEVLEVARNIGFVGIETQASTEMHLKKLKSARMIDIRELPKIISEDAQSPLVYALRYVEQPFQASFSLHKHKNLALDPAIADRVDYTYVLSPEGHVQAEAKIFLRNSRKQFLHLGLPSGVKLLSAYLDNQSIKPTRGEKGEILLPLKRQPSQPFVLEIVFEYAETYLNAVGGWTHLTFPKMDIPVSLVTSQFFVPEDFSFSQPWGDFKNVQTQGYVSWYKRGEKTEEDGPENNLGGGFRTYNQVIDKYKPDDAKYESHFAIYSSPNQAHMYQDRESKNFSGTLPLKIDLPKKGTQIVSNAFYIHSNQPLEIRFVYAHRLLSLLFDILLGLFVFVLGASLTFWKRLNWSQRTAIISLLVLLNIFVMIGQNSFWVLLVLGFVVAFLKKKNFLFWTQLS